ncbi:hypothetical protein [uncultured Rikenella sp.]|uniref:hypothetical protein n=1 Tax=uncultured Rikenella sp. TaxID=368003 RepID=UPI00262E27B1|nr:hypothetical protein [uncultured Rikenella sp.]
MKNPLIHTSFDFEYLLADAMPVAKEINRSLSCPVHHRQASLSFDYDNAGTNAYVVAYCCLEHAQVVAQALCERELFDRVEIEKQNDLA